MDVLTADVIGAGRARLWMNDDACALASAWAKDE
jgi:hypothetical protein